MKQAPTFHSGNPPSRFLFRHKRAKRRTATFLIAVGALVCGTVGVLSAPRHRGITFNGTNQASGNAYNGANIDFAVARLQPAAGSMVVNSTADVVNGSDGLCTLREAIQSANSNTASGAAAGECEAGNASDPDTINFSVTGTITLLTTLPDLSTSMSINGPGANLLTISGNN